MKRYAKFSAVVFLAIAFVLGQAGLNTAQAATAPSLGDAESFSVLAGLSMSAAGAGTTISGDLGLSPGLAVSRTGPWTVGGSEYFGVGGLSADAQADALGAFNDLAGQISDGPWGATPWSPEPGTWTVALDTTFTGTITLDGDYDDVWVFQVGQDMTFSGAVVLAGNAQACNVFWQIGRDATIALGSDFVGSLIASRDITLVSGATVDGQVISLNSSLTTDGNTISGPTCTAAPDDDDEDEDEDEDDDDVDIKVTKEANPSALSGQGSVTYTYKVSNEGDVSLKDISVEDDKCSPVIYVSGKKDKDGRLDGDEVWKYTCTKKVYTTETNTVTARGSASGEDTRDTDKVTVVVSSAPGFPSSGIGPGNDNLWDIISQKLLSFFSF